jgi:hypothetical protein
VLGRHPVIIKVANSWLILNQGGGPPTTSQPSPDHANDPNRTSTFLNIRVADIDKVYRGWSARGAEFLTEPRTTDASSARSSATPTGTSSRSARRLASSPDSHALGN